MWKIIIRYQQQCCSTEKRKEFFWGERP